MKTINLFGEEVAIIAPVKDGGVKPGRTKSGSYINNPMISLHGTTEGEKCKTCEHLVAKKYSKTYYKCRLRGNVDKCSTVSDHKVNWPACGKYEKNEK